MCVTSDISAKYQRPVKRKIWLWSKADQTSLKPDMQCFSQTFTEKNSIKTDVNTFWSEFSSKCLELMSKHVPSKETYSRYSQPWINQGLKRRKKAYNRQRRTKKKEDWAAYKQLKKDNLRECRKAYSSQCGTIRLETRKSCIPSSSPRNVMQVVFLPSH